MQQGTSAQSNAAGNGSTANGAATNANVAPANVAPENGSPDTSALVAATKHLTDEQILELDGPIGAAPIPDRVGQSQSVRHSQRSEESLLDSESTPKRDSSADTNNRPQNDNVNANANTPEPAWLTQLESQLGANGGPQAAAEARRWREAALNSAALDNDYFSAEPSARAELAARLHQTDPAAFRAMLADAARVLAERDPQSLAVLAQQLSMPSTAAKSIVRDAAWNTLGSPGTDRRGDPSYKTSRDGDEFVAQVGGPQSGTRPEAFPSAAANSPGDPAAFPAEAYRQFASETNGDIERQVRDSIGRTLASTLGDGIADGARRRIGDDIFRDLNAALSADRDLSAQITNTLSSRRFDGATSRQIASLLANRARVALPEVARRVISEWTSSVLASDRAKQARIESAVSRRDITGGRLPEPIASSALLPRRFDYARTSDEQILEM